MPYENIQGLQYPDHFIARTEYEIQVNLVTLHRTSNKCGPMAIRNCG